MLLEFRMLPNGNFCSNSEETKKKLSKMKRGDLFLLDYKPKRNVQFNRKIFALLKIVFQNQSKYDNMEDLRTEMKLKSGWYQTHITTKGKLIYIPKSMSFSEMDAIEFEEIYSKFIDIALKHFVPMDKQELEMEIIRFV